MVVKKKLEIVVPLYTKTIRFSKSCVVSCDFPSKSGHANKPCEIVPRLFFHLFVYDNFVFWKKNLKRYIKKMHKKKRYE